MSIIAAENAPSASQAMRFGGFQIRITALCALIAMLDGFDTQAIAYVAPSIAKAWALDMAAFGRIFGGGLLGLAIGALALAPAADRFGRKKLLLVCLLLFGVFALLTARAESLNELLAYRVLTSIG